MTEPARRVVGASAVSVDSAAAIRYADGNIVPDALALEFADVIDLRPAGVRYPADTARFPLADLQLIDLDAADPLTSMVRLFPQ